MASAQYKNQLLLALSKADRALIGVLEPIQLELGQFVERARSPIDHVYFPDSGIISVVVKSGAEEIEAGLIGREGMSGIAVMVGDQRAPNDAYVQMAGSGHRVSAKRFRAAIEGSKSIRSLVQRYSQTFFVQVAQTAFANGTATIEKRLARWLLMAHDRQDDHDLRLTHEFIAVMLGVRRSGVTEALHILESKKFIRANRGVIQLSDRKGLLAFAGGIYGAPEAEYDRLLKK